MQEPQSESNQIIMRLPLVSSLEARVIDSIGQVASTLVDLQMVRPTFKPGNGTIQIDPQEGVANNTQFVVQLLGNWNLDGDTNLNFKVWGANQDSERFEISEAILYRPNQQYAFIGSFPQLSYIETEIWGSTGDRIFERTEVNVYTLPPTGFSLNLRDSFATADKENTFEIVLDSEKSLMESPGLQVSFELS
jgi:hypothetical protein